MKILSILFILIGICTSTYAAELHEYWSIAPTGAQKIINGELIVKPLNSSTVGASIAEDGVITCKNLTADTITGSVVYTSTLTSVSATSVTAGTLGSDVVAQTLSAASVGLTQLGTGIMKYYDYAVEFSTPGAMGTGPWLISPYRSYSVTISSISAHVVGTVGDSATIMIRIRDVNLPDSSTGTNIWTANVVAPYLGWGGGSVSGGSPNNFYIPANSCLAVHVQSTAGVPVALVIKYKITIN